MKLALVTGTSRGIGEQTAIALLSRGWEVWGLARGDAPAALAGVSGYRHDRVDARDLCALRDWAEGPFLEQCDGNPSRFALINNAGVVAPVKPVTQLSPEEWTQVLSVNLAAPAWLTGFALRQFRELPLRVVDLSSGAATAAYPGWGAYCSSKAALRMLGQVVREEVETVASCRHPDFALVSYAPGVVSTQMQEHLRGVDPDLFPPKHRFVALHEEGKLLDPARPAAEIAAIVEEEGLPTWSERRFGS